MTLYGFFFHVIQIHNSGGWRRRVERDAERNFEAHDQNTQRLARVVGYSVPYTRSQVRKIVRTQRMRLVTVLENARALQNKVDFLFAIVKKILALPLGFDCNFAKMRNASQNSIVGVAGAKNWLVVAGRRGKIRLGLTHLRNEPMQP